MAAFSIIGREGSVPVHVWAKTLDDKSRVRIRKVEGSTPFESIKRRIVLNDTAFLFTILCKIVHHSS